MGANEYTDVMYIQTLWFSKNYDKPYRTIRSVYFSIKVAPILIYGWGGGPVNYNWVSKGKWIDQE